MSSRINIFDHSGKWLTEVDATFNRNYKLNEFGSGTFTISTQDPKCREDYLQFGNFVFVEHDKLPDWGGMIDTPRQWGNGIVTVTAYTGEYILTFMLSERTRVIKGVYGAVYQRLIEELFDNDLIKGMTKVGTIFGGGKSIKRVYHWEYLYDAIRKLVKESGNDFEFIPSIDTNGRLSFLANWYEKRGMLKNFILYEDYNIKLSDQFLREQGRIANQIRLVGEGATFDEKPGTRRHDEESMAKYGVRFLSQSGQQQGGDLNDEAEEILAKQKQPRKTFDLSAIDIGDTFAQCRVGDTLPIVCYSVGFTGSGFGTSSTIRILQMNYDEQNNLLKLVADEDI